MDRVERSFYVNDPERNEALASHQTNNYISTTKYTFWNFLPLALLYQFKRSANIYFMVQAILNSIPAVSAMNPISAYLPLFFVLGVSVIREGLEDYQRYKSDKVTNKQAVRIVRDGLVVEAESKDICTGDIVLVHEDEFFPADLILLASCNDKANCLIKTSSLDGETAPKIKKVSKGLDWLVPSGSNEFAPDQFLCTAKVDIEAPNCNLYSF